MDGGARRRWRRGEREEAGAGGEEGRVGVVVGVGEGAEKHRAVEGDGEVRAGAVGEGPDGGVVGEGGRVGSEEGEGVREGGVGGRRGERGGGRGVGVEGAGAEEAGVESLVRE